MNLRFVPIAVVLSISSAGVWLVTVLAFAVGAAIGSFLNVVAYRLPLRMSLNRPGSQCPACGHPIRWYHNVPIFGWLVLGGRCRDCRASISPRYPIVELLAAIATALVVWCAIRPVVGSGDAGSWGIDLPRVVVHLLLVYTLLCTGLLEFDGHRGPLKLLVAVLAAGVGLSALWSARPEAGESATATVLAITATLAAALMLGSLAWPMLVGGRADAIRTGVTRALELALVGVFLGLTPLAVVSVLAGALFLVVRIVGRFWPSAARFGWAASLAAGTLIWVAAGGEIVARLPAAIQEDSLAVLLAAGSILAVLSIAGRMAPGVLR